MYWKTYHTHFIYSSSTSYTLHLLFVYIIHTSSTLRLHHRHFIYSSSTSYTLHLLFVYIIHTSSTLRLLHTHFLYSTTTLSHIEALDGGVSHSDNLLKVIGKEKQFKQIKLTRMNCYSDKKFAISCLLRNFEIFVTTLSYHPGRSQGYLAIQVCHKATYPGTLGTLLFTEIDL